MDGVDDTTPEAALRTFVGLHKTARANINEVEDLIRANKQELQALEKRLEVETKRKEWTARRLVEAANDLIS